MNNRIRDLAHEAGLLTYNPEGIPTKLEKFAELIVRECIDIASQEDFDVMMKEGYPCSQTAKKIKEHFGVEE